MRDLHSENPMRSSIPGNGVNITNLTRADNLLLSPVVVSMVVICIVLSSAIPLIYICCFRQKYKRLRKYLRMRIDPPSWFSVSSTLGNSTTKPSVSLSEYSLICQQLVSPTTINEKKLKNNVIPDLSNTPCKEYAIYGGALTKRYSLLSGAFSSINWGGVVDKRRFCINLPQVDFYLPAFQTVSQSTEDVFLSALSGLLLEHKLQHSLCSILPQNHLLSTFTSPALSVLYSYRSLFESSERRINQSDSTSSTLGKRTLNKKLPVFNAIEYINARQSTLPCILIHENISLSYSYDMKNPALITEIPLTLPHDMTLHTSPLELSHRDSVDSRKARHLPPDNFLFLHRHQTPKSEKDNHILFVEPTKSTEQNENNGDNGDKDGKEDEDVSSPNPFPFDRSLYKKLPCIGTRASFGLIHPAPLKCYLPRSALNTSSCSSFSPSKDKNEAFTTKRADLTGLTSSSNLISRPSTSQVSSHSSSLRFELAETLQSVSGVALRSLHFDSISPTHADRRKSRAEMENPFEDYRIPLRPLTFGASLRNTQEDNLKRADSYAMIDDATYRSTALQVLESIPKQDVNIHDQHTMSSKSTSLGTLIPTALRLDTVDRNGSTGKRPKQIFSQLFWDNKGIFEDAEDVTRVVVLGTKMYPNSKNATNKSNNNNQICSEFGVFVLAFTDLTIDINNKLIVHATAKVMEFRSPFVVEK